MEFSPVLLAVALASCASCAALAEPAPNSTNHSAVTATDHPLLAADTPVADSNNPRTPPADPPAASRKGGVTGSVLGVDPHARIVTVRVDHSVDGLHTGDRIRLDKTASAYKTVRRHPIHRKTRTVPARTAPPRRAPAVVPNESAAPPASSTPPAANAAPPNTGSSPAEENSAAGTATLPPASPLPAAPPPANAPGGAAAPSASTIPPELGLVPRRSGGFVPGSTTPSSL